MAGVMDTILYTDTLQVGDTVLMPMAIQGYYDYLTSFRAVADTNALKVSFLWDEEHNSYLTSTADPAHGYLVFAPEKVFSGVVTLCYTPQKAGSHTVELQIASSAPTGFSQGAGQFTVNVK